MLKPSVSVILACNGERIDEASVETLDIAEDIEGRDIITFTCPKCGKAHESLRFSEYRFEDVAGDEWNDRYEGEDN